MQVLTHDPGWRHLNVNCMLLVQPPPELGIQVGCTQHEIANWLRCVKQVLHERFCAAYVQRVRNVPNLSTYLQWQPSPHLHPIWAVGPTLQC